VRQRACCSHAVRRVSAVCRVSSVHKMRAALEAAGVEFIPENGGGAGVRLNKSAPTAPHLPEGEAGIIENNEMWARLRSVSF